MRRMEQLARISEVHRDAIRAFCERWRIVELGLFGSVLRDDFHDGSDIDVLVRFEDLHQWTVLDHFSMEQELSAILQRRAEITSRLAVEQSPNWIRRREILSTARTLYAA